ncbi:protein MET1, chloroplastic-like [Zingiber officinale]|uniref:protein MET1, chloroplastic-like n=1 Tax=Zingiber officinale TaxID=94328 RepID=UPI001C4C54E3|nr:protein MET1, chloroplastic-like [Zingiber officinale]
MAIVAPAANPFLCSSPSLSTPHPSRRFALQCLPSRTSHKPLLSKRSIRAPRASPSSSSSATEESQPPKSKAAEEGDQYEVELDKPYGLKFMKGSDRGTYIDAIAPGSNADRSGKFTVGDKVIATSAVFGTEIWPAAEYGRTMYTIRQRIGPLLMKMEKRYGKLPGAADLTEREIIRAERNSGVVSDRVREIQMQNYLRKQQQKEQRQNDLREGLKLYRSGKYEDALEKFESMLGSRPEPDEISVASYNVACCYSKLNQVQAALSALEDAMKAGYEDFKTIRNDPDLAQARASEEFEPLLKKFDESFINESAINAIKSIFGFNKK